MCYRLVRQLLFLLPPETAHGLVLHGLTYLQRMGLWRTKPVAASKPPITVMGLSFPNPIGLAAGLDKNGEYLDGLASLGFGFLEIGTITPKPQPGNPQPRLFRLVPEAALINRMGFNNKGVDYLISQIKRARYRGILGINIGKNASTPIENAIDDYTLCMEKVYPYASYIVVNLSSPNTPGLRELQHGKLLRDLLGTLKALQQTLAAAHQRYVPLVVKVAPDLRDVEIDDIAKALLEFNIDGLIATNTTFSREGVMDSDYGQEVGGLSGQPLTAASTHIVAEFHRRLQGKLPIIGVGGIASIQDVENKLAAGASLVQVYTGLIYEGPTLVARLVKGVSQYGNQISQ